MTTRKKKVRTKEQRKSNLYFFKVVTKEGNIVKTGSSKDYTSILIEAQDFAREFTGYWQILNYYGKTIDDNLPKKMEVK